MSRNPGARKQAKKARRTKRRAHRDARWHAINTELNAMAEQIASAAKRFDAWITSRGWIIDADNATDEVVSWVYPPSAAEVPPPTQAMYSGLPVWRLIAAVLARAMISWRVLEVPV